MFIIPCIKDTDNCIIYTFHSRSPNRRIAFLKTLLQFHSCAYPVNLSIVNIPYYNYCEIIRVLYHSLRGVHLGLEVGEAAETRPEKVLTVPYSSARQTNHVLLPVLDHSPQHQPGGRGSSRQQQCLPTCMRGFTM